MIMTIEELNSLPLNHKSRDMLILLGEKPDPNIPYCIQLALWGLKRLNLEVEEGVKEFIHAMPSWRPSRFMNFFMLPSENIKGDIHWEDATSPEELVYAIITYIEDKIAHHFPFYFSVE